jgi:hypothetical protein
MDRKSFPFALAEARAWASEGWNVTIVDNENAAVIDHLSSPATDAAPHAAR